MTQIEVYRRNPCGVLSIPYWKSKRITIPENMRIVHNDNYEKTNYLNYCDEPYFRLFHSLSNVRNTALDGITIVTANHNDILGIVDVINDSYADLSVTYEQMIGYTETEVFCPELWILAVDKSTGCIAGCGIADLDSELREGIIEWIQVLPRYRKRGIAQILVNELLSRMKGKVDFATVSGKLNDSNSPEKLYRKCGFVGKDIWHVLTAK